MRVSYSSGYHVPLPQRHPFPMGKFPALYKILASAGVIRPENVIEPREAEWTDLLTVHSPEYLNALGTGTLGRKAERKMGLPWSEALVRRSRLAVQGTVNAALVAIQDGIAANLAGGTHHAFPSFGEGFCVLNDVAVAIRLLKRSKWINSALVVDLDVHQGNGTASIFATDPTVCTLSVHGEKNFPFHKEKSDFDVALPDDTDDRMYMKALAEVLPTAFSSVRPDIVFYLAGVDVLAGDRFGRMSLTPAGLAHRDAMVLNMCKAAGVPVVLLLSGGYAESPEKTAEYHSITHTQARRIFGESR